MSDKEKFYCLNCGTLQELNSNARCASCNSDSVVPEARAGAKEKKQ